MSYLDEAIEKRRIAQENQAVLGDKKASLDAVKEGADDIVDATKPLAKSTDIDSLIAQVKEVQLAAMLGASKPSVVLTDQTDLGERMTALGDKIAETVSKLDTSKADTAQLTAIKELKSTFDALAKTMKAEASTKAMADKALVTAIKAINISPVVNVPTPKVTVEGQKVDLSPLQDTLKEYFKQPEVSDSIDLECYKAQDLTNSGDYQYVGFLNPDGGWYILENDVKGNKMRYIFGNSGYAEAFAKAGSYEYLLLNEAVDALTA